MTTDSTFERLHELTNRLARTRSSEEQLRLSEEINQLTKQFATSVTYRPQPVPIAATAPTATAIATLPSSPSSMAADPERSAAMRLEQLGELYDKGYLDAASYGKAVKLLVERVPE